MFFTIIPLATCFHEVGHLLSAYCSHARNIVICVGTGKEIVLISTSRFSIIVKMLPFGGSTTYELNKNYNLVSIIVISLAGPVVNGLVVLGIFGTKLIYVDGYIAIWFLWFALFNLWMCMVNLIPFKLGIYSSDGWIIYQTIKKHIKSFHKL